MERKKSNHLSNQDVKFKTSKEFVLGGGWIELEGPRVQGHLQLHSEFKVSPTQNPDLKGKIKKKKKKNISKSWG